MLEVARIVKQQDLFIEIHIADLHFGVMDPEVQYSILKNQFLDQIAYLPYIDIISVNGDIFDHKFMASSNAVMYANYFIQNLAEIARIHNATLLLISGTASHDADQLRLFYPLMNKGIDVRIINEVCFQYIKGKRILCIPELYNKGQEYYLGYLYNSGQYDSCYMHGTFKGAIAGKYEHDLDSAREPVFDIQDFALCKGPIISGHNHVHSCYSNDFYYCGSPIRWRFGEEKEKGYIILLHNISTRSYVAHFEPIVSFKYTTVNLDDMLYADPNYLVNYIKSLKSNGIDYLRVIFTRDDSDKIAILKAYFSNKSNVVIQTDFERKQIEENLQTMEDKYKTSMYMFDKNLSPEDILVRYMNEKQESTFWTVDSFNRFIADIKNL